MHHRPEEKGEVEKERGQKIRHRLLPYLRARNL
jgi:hypothetical protein